MGERERISDRFKNAAKHVAKQAVSPARARAVLGQRLVVMGLALVCLAGGIDYFHKADGIRLAATGMARDAGATSVADAADALERTVEETKQGAIARLPAQLRAHLAMAALLLGLTALAVGTRMRLLASDDRFRALRDIGRVIAAPGFLGIVAFVLLTARSYRLRVALKSFLQRMWDGAMSASDVAGLTKQYAPWAWSELWGVFVVGLLLVVLAVALRLVPTAEESPHRPRLRFAHRLALWAGLLALGYYATATAAAIASYGSALSPFMTWPWKLTPGAFLTSILFMATGIAMARTGSVGMKQADVAAA